MEKSFRIHTNITGDTLLNVNMKQDFDFLEILSLKLRQKDAYRLHSSNYGVIVGRVLANDAFGIPNAKVSVFIERDTSDPNEMRYIYPYSEVMSKDSEGRRYNLLPDYSDDTCYRVVGTFPRKRYMLDDDMQLEIFDKYWKYTTVTNQAGDYMIFGVPAGGQQIHVDIDLSDIGILSQKPRDFIFKGFNVDEFDSPSQFKESTNLDGLQQIISQNKSTVVYPFWGDPENGVAAITRCDVQVNYKFEPTCVFMGSIVSDNEGNSIGHKCAPSVDSGMNNQLVAGEGTIEMIRKTTDGLVEEFPIKGNALIDSDGVWCYQIPMNLDYVGTDEYGNIVPTEDTSKGIPTRTQVRFRISKTESGDEGFSRHTAKYLVPMNPIMNEDSVVPTTEAKTGLEMERMYSFGSNTPQSCFRDLYWNNVYSVKNYIPKVQVASKAYSTNYGALKGSNLVDNQNPVPFNKLRVDVPFSFMIICILFTIVMVIVHFINLLIYIIQAIRGLFIGFKIFGKRIGLYPFKLIIPKMGCVSLSAGLGDGSNVAYYPGCSCPDSEACKNSSCPEGMEGSCTKSSNNSDLKDKIQQSLALDYKIIKLDFYQDWLNGCLYMPLWYWRKAKKKTFLFFTLSGAKNEYCSCDKEYSRLKTYVTCNINYKNNSLGTDNTNTDEGEDRWHKTARAMVRYKNGLIKGVKNKEGLTAYYYVGFQANAADKKSMPIERRTEPFKFVRLFATDIILLGNLNENNIYGIPQFFTALPSTTANIPPIATIEESLSDNDKDDGSDTVSDGGDDSGTTVTTGMDWGHGGGGQTPNYKNGLFMDLACTYAGTKAKSCINVERLSEFGVNLDSSYEMSYAHNSNGIKTGVIDADGFISKLELDDLDNRATFATLNHIGFIPQDYQDSISGYTTQVQDENTGYLVPKFKYVYPVDFDGRLQPIMERYKRGFEQALYDETDESYLTFRLGAENDKDNKEKNLEGRIRHFYDEWSMPVYNNSYYFYFGINKGNTAIDKFNKLFYSPCFQRNKAPFSFTVDSMGKSYCPSMYGTNEKAYNGYGYIRFTSDDIIPPFSYTLLDAASNVVVPTETGMTETDFVIGGSLSADTDGTFVKMNPGGIVTYQLKVDDDNNPVPVPNGYGISGLTNQVYVLEVTDSNGRKISERVELKMPKIALDFETEPLKTKFTSATRREYICDLDNKYYGIIRIKSFSVDGSLYYITGCDYSVPTKIKVTGQTSCDSPYTAVAVIKLGTMEGSIGSCMCTGEGAIEKKTIIVECDTSNSSLEDGWKPMEIIIHMYQPNRYTLTISQMCDLKELSDNTTSDIAAVLNGVNFNTFLNDMPVRFMLGSTTDIDVANSSYFYKTGETATSPTDVNISGWYGLHQEDTYKWSTSDNQVLRRNTDMWSDFVDFGTDITTHNSKGKILEYKFNTMFSLASAGYVIDDPTTFYYEAVGGVTPTLYRNVVPKYSDLEGMRNTYVLSDSNTAAGQIGYLNIVGNNYAWSDGRELHEQRADGPNFNNYYGNEDQVGNYFAAFTNNGGYTSKTSVDTTQRVVKIPASTKVSPSNSEKKLGRDVTGNIGTFRYANRSQNGYHPYLRTLFVDRRLDFNMILFAPCVANDSINLYPESESYKEKLWRTARISGVTYNGVEMSYDRDYNIISADFPVDDAKYMYIISGETRHSAETTNHRVDREHPPVIKFGDSAYTGSMTSDVINETWTVKIPSASTEPISAGTIYQFYKIVDDAVPNDKLEYSYNYSDSDVDAKTIYNSNDNMIWEEDAYGIQALDCSEQMKDRNGNPMTDYDGNPIYIHKPIYDDNDNPVYEFASDDPRHSDPLYKTGKNPIDGQILKRFYEATFIGRDIRNFFWSTFNKDRLTKYASAATINDYNYVYGYPSGNTALYNGDFNRLNVINQKNYPTRRFIDIGNIEAGESYDLTITNCSYANSVHYNSDGTITSEVQEADGINISTSFESPITVIPPSLETEDYANVIYGNRRKEGEYTKFTTTGVSIGFTVNPSSNDDFSVYAAAPKIIKVLPFRNGNYYDGITHIKTVTPNGEISARGNVYNAIGEVELWKFEDLHTSPTVIYLGLADTIVPNSDIHLDCFQDPPDDSDTRTRSEFYLNGGGGTRTYLTMDSTEYQGISYYLRKLKTAERNVYMFAILIEKLYVSKNEDGLTRRMSTFEFSELFDVRPIFLKLDSARSSGETYVEVRAIEVEQEQEQQNGGDGGNTNDDPAPVTKTEYVNSQIMTFEFYFPDKDNPADRACEAIANTGKMSYTLKLKNANEDTFNLTPFEATNDASASSSEMKVKLKFRWQASMGLMKDEQWRGRTKCTLSAKSGSNFIYQIPEFSLRFNGQMDIPTTPDPETKYYTYAEMM